MLLLGVPTFFFFTIYGLVLNGLTILFAKILGYIAFISINNVGYKCDLNSRDDILLKATPLIITNCIGYFAFWKLCKPGLIVNNNTRKYFYSLMAFFCLIEIPNLIFQLIPSLNELVSSGEVSLSLSLRLPKLSISVFFATIAFFLLADAIKRMYNRNDLIVVLVIMPVVVLAGALFHYFFLR